MAVLLLATPAIAQGLRLESAGGMSGLNFYEAGEWGLVRTTITNESDQPAEALLLIGLKDAPGVQYGNRLNMPPRSRREVLTLLTPFGVPANDDKQGRELNVTLVATDGAERAVGSAIGVIPLPSPDMRSAMAAKFDDDGPRRIHGALRTAAGLRPTTYPGGPRSAPEDAAAWGALDVFVLAEANGWSAAQIRAIRHWVYEGGRLWIMLDQTGPELPRAILGQNWPLAWVDRVGYTDLTIQGDGVSHAVTSDYPIEMARVLAGDPAETLLTAHGYPAALRWSCGEGEVWVTTVAAGGWLSDAAASPALAALTDVVKIPDRDLRRSSADGASAWIEPVATRVQGLVGHRVLGRGAVVAVLGLFLVVVLGAGMLLHRKGALEWTAPVGVVVAVIAAVVLVAMGWTSLGNTEGVTAISTISRQAPAVPTTQVAGLIGVYRQPGAPRLSRLQYEGPPPVVDARLARSSPRLLRTDADRWSIENLELAPGEVHTVRLSGPVGAAAPRIVVGELADERVSFRATGDDPPALSDAVLATRTGRLMVASEGPGVWSADVRQGVGESQFIDSTVLSQRQMQRSETYAAVFDTVDLADQPVLIGWTNDAPIDVEAIEGAEIRADGLVVLPVSFQPPPPGESFRLPSVLLAREGHRDRDLGVGGTIFDPSTGRWVENVTNPQTVGMKYLPPEPFVGMDLEAVEIAMDLRAPGRSYELLAIRDGKLVPLHAGQDPAGLISVTLEGADLPSRLPDGSVLIALRIGDLPVGQPNKPWSLSRLDVDLVGSMPAR